MIYNKRVNYLNCLFFCFGGKEGWHKRNIGFGPDPYTSPIDLTRRREASHGERVYHVGGLNYLIYAIYMQFEDLSVPADFISGEGEA